MSDVANSLLSYGDSARKEDVVLNAIEILTARETQIFNMLGKTSAIDTVHHFLTDTLATAGSLAITESQDYSKAALTTPTRNSNVVEIIAKAFAVSRTQQNIEHYHGQNELARQTEKALMEWANAAEFDLIRSTLVSGVSGTAPKMAGIIQATSVAANNTSHTSGTAWSASILDGLMKSCYDASNGDVATDLFMGSKLRVDTDGFVQKTNTVVNGATATGIVRTVSTYETAFGTLMVHTHRYLQQAADATARVLAIRPDKLKVAMLEKPYIDTGLARSGPYDMRAVTGSFTLEVRNKQSHFFADGFLK